MMKKGTTTMHITINKSEFQELFAMLYLRLNGYFTSGFIVHAPRGDCTQVDILAVRFPHNAEPEREVKTSPWLQTPSAATDILVCEIKGQDEQLQFNKPFRNKENAIRSVLRWVGIFDEQEGLEKAVALFQDAIKTREVQTPDTFRYITDQDVSSKIVRSFSLRGVIFAPDRSEPDRNQPRYVYGQEMIDHIWKCLCPTKRRKLCDDRYNFNHWGTYGPIVRYFKGRKEAGLAAGNMQDIYCHFGL